MQLNNTITVADTLIRQDSEGRYCLNDLHKAAVATGANRRSKEPAKFLSSPQTGELVGELETTQNLGSSPVGASEGRNGGTYVCKELVYAYAMWISPAFHLKVIRAYDALVSGDRSAPVRDAASAAMLTPEQYEAERDRLAKQLARLQATPIIVMPEDYERLTGERIKVGKRTYKTVDLIGVLEDCGVPRETIKQIVGGDANYVRQYAFRHRNGKR